MKTAIAITVSIALAACGGGGGGSSEPQSATPQKPSGARVIAFYGDSTTYGSQTNNGQLSQTSKTEPVQIQALFDAWLLGTPVRTENHGIGGTEASQLLLGTGGYARTFDEEMAQSDADVVVLNFALNDSYYPQVVAKAGVIQETPDMYWGYMANLCQIARNHHKICVLEEPNPINGVQNNPNASVFSYVFVLRQVANQMSVPIIPQFDSMLADANWLKDYISDDGVHPNDGGYGFKAMNTYKVLEPIIKGLS